MQGIIKGVKLLRDNVKTTFGPLGKNVIIHTPDGELLITKDGVTVARNTNCFDEPEVQAGIEIVRQAANRTLEEAGDGTSSTVILAGAMIESIELGEDSDINKFKTEASEAVSSIISILDSNVSFEFDLKGIAKTSCNGNIEIASKVSEIVDHCGPMGHFEYVRSFLADSYKLNNGYKFNRGYLNSNFINKPATNSCEYDNVQILIINEKVSDLTKIAEIYTQGVPLIIIAEDFDQKFINMCVGNTKLKYVIIPIKLPEFGEQRQFYLEDLALYCKANITTYEKCNKSDLGSVTGIKIQQDCTIIKESVNFKIIKDSIQDRIEMIQSQLKETSVEYKIKKLKERLASLSSKNAVINIYGATDTEFQERQDLYDDGLKACQNALQFGVLPGGGVALMKAADKARKNCKKLGAGHKFIFDNADSLSKAAYRNKLVKETIDKTFFTTLDLRSGKIDDAIKLNILDSFKTVSSTLVNATSVAMSIVTSSLYINSITK